MRRQASLRASPLNIVPNASGKFVSEFSPLDLAHDALVEVAAEHGEKLLVIHGSVGELPPQLGDFHRLGDLELKLVRPLQ